MKVDISDILNCMDRESKLTLMGASLLSIKIKQDTDYSCEHLVLVFQGGESIKIDVTTMPLADTAFRFQMIESKAK